MDLFSYIGGFSGAGGFQGGKKLDPKADYKRVFGDAKAFAKEGPSAVAGGVGTVEPENMRQGIRGLHTSLREVVSSTSIMSPRVQIMSGRHWRRDLHDFAPRLFKIGKRRGRR